MKSLTSLAKHGVKWSMVGQVSSLVIALVSNALLSRLVAPTLETRTSFIAMLKEYQINAVFYFLSPHKSLFYKEKYQGSELKNCEYFSHGLVRIPMYKELTRENQLFITNSMKQQLL